MLKVFVFTGVLLYSTIIMAQTSSKEDEARVELYREFSDITANDSSYILIKIKPGLVSLFKKQYATDILRQIDRNWFIVNNKKAITGSLFAEKYFTANYNWKLSPLLISIKDSLPPDKQFTFLVEASDSTALRQSLPKGSAILYSFQGKTFQLRATPSFVLKTLLSNQYVTSIAVKLYAPKEETVINDYDNSVNAINTFFAKYPAINSNGLSVSVKENLFDTTDIDFKNRYQPTTNHSIEVTTHATIMATIIGGGGNSFYTGKGIAWGSKLSSSDFANLLPDNNSIYQQYGTTVQNHSYGTEVDNVYGSDAAAFDQSLINNPQLVYIFSAGNSGTLTSANGQYKNVARLANITGSFKQSKNSISVGSVDSFYRIPAASSKGPAYDGRIKPELVAYGNDGSSGAAAIASGTALAIQNAYASLHHDSLPGNALVKALLINSADDVFNEGPDFYSGYGNVNTYKAVRDIMQNNFFEGTVQQNGTTDFSLSIPANTRQLKVTLTWTDAPAQANAFTALINDIDLEVENKSNKITWLPWVLNSMPDSAALLTLPQRKRDSLNVVEQVTIDNPTAGNYTIHVKGYSLATASQAFAVAYQPDTADRFQFIMPAAGDHFTSGGKSIFRWNNTYTHATGRLEYSIDKGDTWQLIDSHSTIDSNYYRWNTPDIFALAIARMTIGNDVYVSDTFNFSKQLLPQVIYACNDSVLVSWNGAGVHQYKVLQLGERYLQEYAVTTDTSLVIKNSSSPYIAVAPLFDDGRTGINSYTFNYNTQGAGCYIDNFLADLTEDNKADLQLFLGTAAQVSSVQFQVLSGNQWQMIFTVQPVTGTHISYLYDSLHNGSNIFRAVVTLGNNNTIISNTAAVLYFRNAPFVIYPNPLQQGQNLTLLSNTDYTGTLVVYDAVGRKITQQNIVNADNIIIAKQFSKGTYFIVVYNDKQTLFKSRLIVQ